jgi:hypothetical protein
LYYQLDKILIKDNKLNVDELNLNFRSYLWNFILYFKIKKLPYDFLLPYENDVEFYDSKEINFNEKESFNVEIKPNFMYKYYKNEDLDEIKTDEIIIEKSLKLLIPKEKKSVFVSKQIQNNINNNNNNNSEENNYNNLLISYDENSSMNSSNNDSHYLKINRNSMKNIKNNLTAVKEEENENVQTTSPKINENRSIDEISSINELNLDEENNEKNKINNYSNNFITTKIKNVQIYKVDNKKNNFFKIKNLDENNHNNIKIISIINKNIEKIRKDSTPIKKILTDNEKIVNKFRKRNCDSFIEIKKTNFNTEINKKKRLKSQEQKNYFNI